MSARAPLPRAAWVAAFWAATVAVGVLSLLPPALPLPSTGWDKANHVLAFAVLGLLGAACWPARRARVLLALAAYGGAIEIAQAASGIRFGEWSDWIADAAGLAVAFLAWQRAAGRTGGKRGSYSEK